MTQVPMTENQLEEMQMMEEVSDHVGMNYPKIPDSRFVAQPVDDFLFPWEEARSAEKPITIDEDEGFSETMTPQNTTPLINFFNFILIIRIDERFRVND